LQRQAAWVEIKAGCNYAFSVVDERSIDEINILQATLSAMAQAINSLAPLPQWVLVDGTIYPDIPIPGNAVISGDSKSISIACASIVAKVIRDEIMLDYDKQYPEYGFAEHKGYGTKSHFEAIFKYGPCAIHRKTFQPIKDLVSAKKSVII
jgi:RNase HII (EC 3.1.26.4)